MEDCRLGLINNVNSVEYDFQLFTFKFLFLCCFYCLFFFCNCKSLLKLFRLFKFPAFHLSNVAWVFPLQRFSGIPAGAHYIIGRSHSYVIKHQVKFLFNKLKRIYIIYARSQ
ncbi:hypothetical protein CCR91_17345 [Thiorhodovibrio winogradskyi]|nr:hypothetical protein [Thiorhodovibrio winogradskyi]